MKYYLAYGSNLNLTQMFHRCPHARVIGHTSLSDMRLVFRGSKTGSYLTVEPGEAASVPCGVFAIQDDDELALDHYEGYPVFYQKQTLHVPEDLHNAHRSPSGASLYVLLEGLQAGLP